MEGAISRRSRTLQPLLAPLCLLVFQSEVSTVASAQTQAPKRHFACNAGYTLGDCQVATTVLRNTLAQYPGARRRRVDLCNERDEIKTNRAAVALKNGTPLSCRDNLVARTLPIAWEPPLTKPAIHFRTENLISIFPTR
jgi:hypothetical protein